MSEPLTLPEASLLVDGTWRAPRSVVRYSLWDPATGDAEGVARYEGGAAFRYDGYDGLPAGRPAEVAPCSP